MKWSWKIAQVAGIPVYIHITFVLLIGFLAISTGISERNLPAVVGG